MIESSYARLVVLAKTCKETGRTLLKTCKETGRVWLKTCKETGRIWSKTYGKICMKSEVNSDGIFAKPQGKNETVN